MSISYAELASLTCPVCRTPFEAEIWTILDARERPDLADMLLSGALNVVTCPQCGHQADAGGPLLVHDPDGRRVYFAAPADAPEHVWRERAQELLYVLVGSLPEEARLPYLSDVQVEVEASGVRRAMLRRGRRFVQRPSDDPESPRNVHTSPAPVEQPDALSVPGALVAAIEELLTADTPAEAAAVVERHPALTTLDADAVIEQLIRAARAHGEHDIAHALTEARVLLNDLRAGIAPGEQREVSSTSSPSTLSFPGAEGSRLADQVYQAFLRAESPRALREAVANYPALLEPWADDELAARVDAALEEGNEHLAQAIELRRDALARLRADMTGGAGLHEAIDALLRAGHDADALAMVVDEYPALLTDAAQTALFELAAGARARGDHALAEYAVECRALLRRVREGLQEE
ncbi:MAG: CpXC domain-containing protein [Roseiflexaceae bacterium]|nr:CpXC domain-containing protein [Roseiflexus sp.]MDW8214876.1 CpXC domain-containing protein [Roseiflexaceae bacterium]